LEKVQAEELKELKQSSLREKGTLTDVGVTVDFSTETTESREWDFNAWIGIDEICGGKTTSNSFWKRRRL
jgi:hypothetical protein